MTIGRVCVIALLLTGAAIIFGNQLHQFSGQSAALAAPPPTGESSQIPPGVKKGARLWYGASTIPFNPEKFENALLVEEVKGSWVLLKGESFDGAAWKEKEASVWINLQTVSWVKVKE